MSYLWNTASTSTTYSMPVTFTTSYQPLVPAPRPLSPLQWLDAEVEKTCAIARNVGPAGVSP